MERVLGSEMLSQPPRQRSRFARQINVIGAVATTVTSVEVQVLDSMESTPVFIAELSRVHS
jgi:hypothetical protein